MVHLGQNIAKLRGMKRLTQKEIATKLNLSQSEYSKIEQKAEIDEDLLSLIASALEISPDALKNFNEDFVIFNIENMNDNAANYQYHFNPIEKVVDLYERLLREKEEIIKQKDDMIEMYKKEQKAS